MAFRTIKPQSSKDEFKKEDNKKVYPSISFKLKHLPEAKDARVGQDFEIVIKARLLGVDTIYGEEARFELRAVKVTKPEKKKKIRRY